MAAMIPFGAELGRFSHDAATTMAVALVVLVAFAYWILKA
jgi:hypothetical protein